jgi:DNA adenine methylase
MTCKDHVDLYQSLIQVKGKVVLSYYDHPVMQNLYAKWHRDVLDVVKSSYGVTKNSWAQERPRAEEILLMNF